MIQVKAQLNNLRIAPRKVRAVVGLIRRKNAVKAINQLEVLSRRPADMIIKLINSAIANAKNRYDVAVEDLFIDSVTVDEGMKLRRYKPKGFGRVSPLEKKTSRITLTLRASKAALKTEKDQKKEKEVVVSEEKEVKSVKKEKRAEAAGEKKVAKPKVTGARKFFQRKAI